MIQTQAKGIVENLEINRQEVLRYLGYGGQIIDEQTQQLLDSCMQELKQKAKPRYAWRLFSLEHRREDGKLLLAEAALVLPGKDIRRHLEGCTVCAVLAATLGVEADNLIRIAQAAEMSRAVVLDACAADLIEKVCDRAGEELAARAAEDGLSTTSRFSPGYGDLPLEIQGDVARLVDSVRALGLTVTENALMIPRKSVTALVGFTPNPKQIKGRSCDSCAMRETCAYRKEGKACGN